MKLSPHFAKVLLQSSVPVDPTKTYKCQNCHRPDLKAEFIEILSRGEAYCKACVNGGLK